MEHRYDYYLGDYKFKFSNGKVYKKVFWFIYKPVGNKRYTNYLEGVEAVNKLAETERKPK